jgi:zinc transporter ZupT
MAAAWLLTFVALGGVATGVFMGQWRKGSSQVAAAGGGLLFGIALFLVIPEIARSLGWALGFALALAACGGLALLDRFLIHIGHSPVEGVIGPLLAATAVHSFLDGWSLRALSMQPVANIAVPLGLALHKFPEGLALGLITRRSMSWTRALGASAIVEGLTLVGATVEPKVNESGAAQFGNWWTAIVLGIVAGSFLFLGFHSFLENWGKADDKRRCSAPK